MTELSIKVEIAKAAIEILEEKIAFIREAMMEAQQTVNVHDKTLCLIRK